MRAATELELFAYLKLFAGTCTFFRVAAARAPPADRGEAGEHGGARWGGATPREVGRPPTPSGAEAPDPAWKTTDACATTPAPAPAPAPWRSSSPEPSPLWCQAVAEAREDDDNRPRLRGARPNRATPANR